MQKVSKLLMLVAVVATAVFTSCDPVDPIDETPGAPAITITDDAGNAITLGIEGEPGDMIDLTVTVDAPGVFNTLVISTVLGTETTEVASFSKNSGDTAVTYTTTFTYTFVEEWVDEAGILEFLAVDDQNEQTTLDLEVNTTSTPVPITSYTATLLLAPLADDSQANFFASEDGQTYTTVEVINTQAAVSITIDFGYYYTSNAGLASPSYWFNDTGLNGTFGDITQWNAKNNTSFRTTTLTAADFDAIGDNGGDEILNAWETGTDVGEHITGLQENQVIAYYTDADKTAAAGKYGLLKVVSISGDYNAGDGMTIDVKIEQ